MGLGGALLLSGGACLPVVAQVLPVGNYPYGKDLDAIDSLGFVPFGSEMFDFVGNLNPTRIPLVPDGAQIASFVEGIDAGEIISGLEDLTSAGVLPDPEEHPSASVRILQACAGGLQGAMTVQSWIVLKEKRDSRWQRFDVVGWDVGDVEHRHGYAPDARWYGSSPEVIMTIDGVLAEDTIPKVKEAIESYPYRTNEEYQEWPGPNSNTFVTFVMERVPELEVSLSSLAVGKDYPVGENWF